MSSPFLNTAPVRTSATRWGALTARHCLLDILRKVGGNPVVTSEKRIDPAQDFAWATGQRAVEGGAAAAAEGWEKFWLDEEVPALLGRTPRQAAQGQERP